MKKIIVVSVITMLIWSCSKKVTSSSSSKVSSKSSTEAASSSASSTSTPTAAPTQSGDANGSKTATSEAPKSPAMMGQATYNAKCGRCHGLKVTTDYTADRWISIMQVMAPKAKLSSDEKENVLAYVKENSKK